MKNMKNTENSLMMFGMFTINNLNKFILICEHSFFNSLKFDFRFIQRFHSKISIKDFIQRFHSKISFKFDFNKIHFFNIFVNVN